MAYVRWALKLSQLPTTARGVALEVASHYSHRDGYARPSWTEIGAVLDLSEASVWRAVRACTDAGIWTVETPRGRATRYRFPLPGAVHTPRADARGVDAAPLAPTRGDPSRQREVPLAPTRGEQVPEQVQEQLALTGTDDASGAVPEWAAARWPHLRVTTDAVPPDSGWDDYA